MTATISELTEHDVQAALVDELMEKEDYKGAAHEAGKLVDELEQHLPTLAQAALTRGKALMTDAMKEMSTTGELPPREIFEKVWNAYELSKQLNPDCAETKHELGKLSGFYKQIAHLPPDGPPKKDVEGLYTDVLVVGAGAAGIGTALMLTKTFGLDKKRVVLLERGHEVGESFRRWPKEMRFISPSFNQQGWTNSFDLNSISKGTSPAFSLHSEHPSGREYAAYLSAIAKYNELCVRRNTEVLSVRAINGEGERPLFSVDVKSTAKSKDPLAQPPQTETLLARYIVWAAGEFQYPHAPPKESSGEEEEKKSEGDDEKEKEEDTGLVGSELCMHNSSVRSWAELPGEDFIVIGGYESGVDATVNLARAGKRCQVLASTPCWSDKTPDPSTELAPYTAMRLREVMSKGFPGAKPTLYAPIKVLRVEKNTEKSVGGYIVTSEWKHVEEPVHAPLRDVVTVIPQQTPKKPGCKLVLHTPNPPVLCTGFEGSARAAAKHLFKFADEEGAKGCLAGAPLLTEKDESTKVPGVFLVGPTVSHGKLSFCFVYKFRQRFAIVADAICEGLGVDPTQRRAAVAECREANMYLDNFSCCGDTCGDVC